MLRIITCLLVLTFLLPSCHVKSGKVDKSSPFFDSAITKAEHMYDAGRKIEALGYIEDIHRKFKPKLNVEDEMNFFSYCNTICMRDLHDYDRSLALADSMLSVLEASGRRADLVVREIQAYNVKADALMEKGNYNQAYDFYFKAKSLAQLNADPCSHFRFNYSLGMVCYRQQKFHEAADYFKQAYNDARYCTEDFTFFYRRQELLDNIGLCFSHARQFDSAMNYFQNALRYIDSKAGNYPERNEAIFETARAVVYGNMADIFMAQNRYDTAEALFKQSVAINMRAGHTNTDGQLTQVKLANLYLSLNQFEKLSSTLAEIKAASDTIHNRYIELQWNKLMSQYYGKMQDSLRMARYLLPYIYLKDSFDERDRAFTAADLGGKVKSMERQNELIILEKDSKLERIYLAIAIIIACLALTILLLLMRNATRAQKNISTLQALNRQVSDQKVELQAALKELELKDRDKTRILRSVAHDVMSPISAVAALTEILINESFAITPEHEEILNLILDACKNSLTLSRDILDAATAIDAMNVTMEETDVNALVAGCVELLSVKALEKKQNLVFRRANHAVIAHVAKEKIWRVVNNLIGNAIKFSFEGGGIDVELRDDGQNVTISVSDTGIGIPEKNKQNIFDMFTESKVYGTSGEKPHGLGLSISLQIAKLHGGNIWFDSAEGRGTTFYFSFHKHAK